MSRLLIVAVAILSLVQRDVLADTFVTVNPYLSFDDSPFSFVDFSAGYFYLEDFEDCVLNTPGAIASTGVFGPGGNTDSVDGDDGVIDGSGTDGHALDLNYTATSGISVIFDEAILGALPTHAGIAWTDGSNDIEFEAFGFDGISLGTQIASTADTSINGTTAEDTFFGVIHPLGISRIVIRSGLPGTESGIEADHLQYGNVHVVPAPSNLVSLAGLLVTVLMFRWKYGAPRQTHLESGVVRARGLSVIPKVS